MVSKETLKSYFETGDVPTQAQFAELIDCCYNAETGEYSTIATNNGSSVSDIKTVVSYQTFIKWKSVGVWFKYNGATSTEYAQYLIVDLPAVSIIESMLNVSYNVPNLVFSNAKYTISDYTIKQAYVLNITVDILSPHDVTVMYKLPAFANITYTIFAYLR